MFNRFKKITLFLGDLVGLHLALFLTLLLRYPQNLLAKYWQNHWPVFWPVFIIWLLILYISNLYDLNLRAKSRVFLGTTANAAIISIFLSILYFYLGTNTNITPKTNLVIFSAIFVIIFLVWRLLSQIAIHSLFLKENLAIIGANQLTDQLVLEIKNNPGAGYQVTWVCSDAQALAALPDNIKSKNIRTVVITDNFGSSAKLSAALFTCLTYNINFFNYPDFYESLVGKVPLEAIDSDWFLNNLREGQKNYFNSLKQLLDWLLAGVILVLSLPLWPLIALIIKLTSRGPVFFRQDREGEKEKIFKIIKFRTMRVDGNDLTPTAEDDQRIFGFGSFLRQTRLDEIPQVLNILRGEMSFIGPRPERPEMVAELEKQIPFYKTRLLIKPGLTGWDQISGAYHSPSVADTYEKLQYDLFYLKHRSFYLDLTIILKTLATMVSRGGR